MKITLLGNPIAKQRARHSTRGKMVLTYDPQSNDKIRVRNQLIDKIKEALNSDDKEKALEASNLARTNSFCVEMWFYLPVRDCDPKHKKNAKLWGLELPACKPDYDNLEKFYLDCASGVLWQDDRMIVEAKAHKRFGEPPRVEIEVMEHRELRLKPKTESLYKLMDPNEFDSLLTDASRLGKQDINFYYNLDGTMKEKWMEETASFLSRFASKYADKLKKISKLSEEE